MRHTWEIRRSWRQALYGYLALARISNCPTVVSNTLAGAALAGALQGGWPDGRVVPVALSMVLFYSAGMYLNDLLDYPFDCRVRPERPLPAGIVSRTGAATVMGGLFATGAALLWSIGLRSFLSGLLLISLIICYDRWHKQNAFSPLLMGFCRAMVYITAFVSCSGRPLSALLIPASLLILYTLGLTYIAKAEGKAVAIHSALAVTLFLPALYFGMLFLRQVEPFALFLAIIFAIWVVYSISFVYHSSTRQSGRAVGQLIAGVSLLDVLVLAEARSFSGVALALLACFCTVCLQRYVKGT
jgi:hypothetical protein